MTTPSIEQRFLTVEEAATYLGCSRDTVERLIADRKLTRRMLRGRPRIDLQEIDQLMGVAQKRRRRA